MMTIATPEQTRPAETSTFTFEEHGWRLAVIAVACLISVFLDQSTSGIEQAIVTYMTGTLGASSDEGLWLQIGYNSAYYLALIATPWMISKFGRRTVWTYGHATFAVASLMIAFSGGFWSVVGWRTLQGLGQGTFFVCAVVTILTVFPKQIVYIGFGLFATTALAGPSLGPAIGGWFSDLNAWQVVFAVMAALAATASLIIRKTLRDPPDARVPSLPTDFLGFFLASIHYFTYHYLLQEGERRDWLGSPQIVTVLVLFLVASVLFFVWEVRCRNPFIQVRLFLIHNVRWGAFLGFILGVPLFGGNIFEQYLQTGISFTPGLAGAELMVRAIPILITVPLVAYALGKQLLDPRYLIVTGFILVALSYWILFLHTTYLSDFGTFILPFVLQGFAFSLLFSPIARTVIFSLPPEKITHGVAIFKLSIVTGGAFASAMLATIVDRRATLHFSQITEGINLAQPNVALFVHGHLHSPLVLLGGVAQQQSYISAYADSNLYTAILALCVAPLAFALRVPKRNK